MQLGLHLLGAGAILADACTATGGAGSGHFALVVAVMAEQDALGFMEGEGDIAARAAHGVTAVPAEDVSSRAAPVQEQDRLLLALEHLTQRLLQRLAENRAVASFQLLAHIDHADRGQIDGLGLTFQRAIVGGGLGRLAWWNGSGAPSAPERQSGGPGCARAGAGTGTAPCWLR